MSDDPEILTGPDLLKQLADILSDPTEPLPPDDVQICITTPTVDAA